MNNSGRKEKKLNDIDELYKHISSSGILLIRFNDPISKLLIHLIGTDFSAMGFFYRDSITDVKKVVLIDIIGRDLSKMCKNDDLKSIVSSDYLNVLGIKNLRIPFYSGIDDKRKIDIQIEIESQLRYLITIALNSSVKENYDHYVEQVFNSPNKELHCIELMSDVTTKLFETMKEYPEINPEPVDYGKQNSKSIPTHKKIKYINKLFSGLIFIDIRDRDDLKLVKDDVLPPEPEGLLERFMKHPARAQSKIKNNETFVKEFTTSLIRKITTNERFFSNFCSKLNVSNYYDSNSSGDFVSPFILWQTKLYNYLLVSFKTGNIDYANLKITLDRCISASDSLTKQLKLKVPYSVTKLPEKPVSTIISTTGSDNGKIFFNKALVKLHNMVGLLTKTINDKGEIYIDINKLITLSNSMVDSTGIELEKIKYIGGTEYKQGTVVIKTDTGNEIPHELSNGKKVTITSIGFDCKKYSVSELTEIQDVINSYKSDDIDDFTDLLNRIKNNIK